MRPLELLQHATPIITPEGMAAIELDPRAYTALRADIAACRASMGIHDVSDMLWNNLTPEGTMRYNGTLYVRGK